MVAFFFKLLQVSLVVDAESALPKNLSSEEWQWIYKQSVKQGLVGVMYCGIQKLPAAQRPPREILLQFAYRANLIRQVNVRMNTTAAKVSQLFEEKGLHPVILKGQANAKLYPDPFSRQAGDIDVLIDGGRSGVLGALRSMNLIDGAEVSKHHVHLPSNYFNGISVEVHFVPTSSFSPSNNQNLLKFLNGELINCKKVDEGFYVPNMAYALVMQLSHLKQHFFGTGIGLRQLVDYRQLLLNCSTQERKRARDALKKCGLCHMAGAVMWVMQEVFCLGDSLLLCPPDKKRGDILLNVILSGGDFGQYSKAYELSLIKRWLSDRLFSLKMMKFDFSEGVWHEVFYWKWTLSLIPKRIKKGKIALGRR